MHLLAPRSRVPTCWRDCCQSSGAIDVTRRQKSTRLSMAPDKQAPKSGSLANGLFFLCIKRVSRSRRSKDSKLSQTGYLAPQSLDGCDIKALQSRPIPSASQARNCPTFALGVRRPELQPNPRLPHGQWPMPATYIASSAPSFHIKSIGASHFRCCPLRSIEKRAGPSGLDALVTPTLLRRTTDLLPLVVDFFLFSSLVRAGVECGQKNLGLSS